MEQEKMPSPWGPKKGGTIAEKIAIMNESIARLEESIRLKREAGTDTGYERNPWELIKKRDNLSLFLAYESKVEVIDDNRLRFDDGIIFPKSLKVKFNNRKTHYEYKDETMKAFMDKLPAIDTYNK